MKKPCNHNEMVWAGDKWKCALCGYGYDDPEGEIDRLRAENEQLLAACKVVAAAGVECHKVARVRPVWLDQVESAIAKAEGSR